MNTKDKKIVFFDADGTVCDIEKGVPASAEESIRKLVENGHEAWLCTGRSSIEGSCWLDGSENDGMSKR